MFKLFKTSKKDALEKKYKKLLQEAFNLSKTNRKLSDTKYAEAEAVLVQIENL